MNKEGTLTSWAFNESITVAGICTAQHKVMTCSLIQIYLAYLSSFLDAKYELYNS
jgi:hypothetical protein